VTMGGLLHCAADSPCGPLACLLLLTAAEATGMEVFGRACTGTRTCIGVGAENNFSHHAAVQAGFRKRGGLSLTLTRAFCRGGGKEAVGDDGGAGALSAMLINSSHTCRLSDFARLGRNCALVLCESLK